MPAMWSPAFIPAGLFLLGGVSWLPRTYSGGVKRVAHLLLGPLRPLGAPEGGTQGLPGGDDEHQRSFMAPLGIYPSEQWSASNSVHNGLINPPSEDTERCELFEGFVLLQLVIKLMSNGIADRRVDAASEAARTFLPAAVGIAAVVVPEPEPWLSAGWRLHGERI